MKNGKNEIEINDDSNQDQINVNHFLSLITNPKETNKYLEILKEQFEEYYIFNNSQYNRLTELYFRFNSEKKGNNFINTPIYHLHTIFNKMIQMQIKLYESIVNKYEIFNLIGTKFVKMEKIIEDISKNFNLSSYSGNIYNDTNSVFTSMMEYVNELETKVIDEYIWEKYKKHTLGANNNETAEDLVIRIKCLERSIYDYFQTKKNQHFDKIKQSDNKLKLIYNDIKNYLLNYITNLKDAFKNFYNDLDEFENNISSKPKNINKDNNIIYSESDFQFNETDFYTTKYKIKIITNRKVVLKNKSKLKEPNTDLQLVNNTEDKENIEGKNVLLRKASASKNLSNQDKIESIKNDSPGEDIYLSGKEIFEIVSKLYSYEIKILDKSQYVLDLEKGKLLALESSNKILSYSEDLEEIKIKLKKEYKEIMDIINTKIVNNIKNLEAFFIALNNYRATSKINFNEMFYDIVIYIYSKAQEFVIKNSNKRIEDLMLILSQTYYKENNGKKIYLLEGLKSHELYKKIDFWKNNIIKNIEDEFKTMRNNHETNVLSQNKKEEIIKYKLLSYNNLMKDYNFSKDKIIELFKQIFDKYKYSENSREEMISYINQDI